MTVQEQIKAAIGVHGMWKSRLHSAIDHGSSEFTPGKVRRDDQCDFGKWLAAAAPSARSSPDYQKCVELHRQFHGAAAKVLELAIAGNKDAAKEAMKAGGDFARTSGALTMAMMAWSCRL